MPKVGMHGGCSLFKESLVSLVKGMEMLHASKTDDGWDIYCAGCLFYVRSA